MGAFASYLIDDEGRILEDASFDRELLRSTRSRRIRRAEDVAGVPRELLLAAISRAKTAGIAGIRGEFIVLIRSFEDSNCYGLSLCDAKMELPPAALLRDLYELTTSEANVALAAADGANAKELAAMFSISNNTARVHLQRILSKTGCSRQTQLVRLILSLGDVLTPEGTVRAVTLGEGPVNVGQVARRKGTT